MDHIQERIRHISSRVLDGIEAVLATLNKAPAARQPPLAVARRALANTLGLWHFCGQRSCRRSHCCRGEPSHCLNIALPLLPPGLLAGLTARKRRRRSEHR
jgi:hypothetical protein